MLSKQTFVILAAGMALTAAGCGNTSEPGVSAPPGTAYRTSEPSETAVTGVVVPFRAGYNPLAFQAPRLTALSPNSNVPGVFRWDGTQYVSTPFAADALNGRTAYWAFASAPTNITYSAADDGTQQFVDLGINGYQLVSFATSVDVPGSALVATQGGRTVSLASVVLPVFYEINADGSYTNVDVTAGGVLKPGKAYWVFANTSAGAIRLSYGSVPAPSPSPAAVAASLTIDPGTPYVGSLALAVNATQNFKVLARDAAGAVTDVTAQAQLSVTSGTILELVAAGAVKALAGGEAAVIATFGGRAARLPIAAQNPQPYYPPTNNPGGGAAPDWTPRTSGTTNQLNSVDFANSLFLAAGNSGTVRTSTDGLTWTASLTGSNDDLKAAIFANTRFIIANQNSSSNTLFSPTAASGTWTRDNTEFIINSLAAANGYVAGCSASQSQIQITNATPPFSTSEGSAFYAGTGNLGRGIAFGTGTRFVVVGTGGMIQRTDITSLSPTMVASTSPTAVTLNGVCSNGGTTFVAVGNGGTIVRSTDNGVTFTQQATGLTTQSLNAVAFGNGQYIAVGNTGTILTSPDGVTWTADNSGVSTQLLGVAISGARAVAVGAGGLILSKP